MQRPTAPVPAQNPLQSSIADDMMNEPTLTVQCRGQMMPQEVRVSLDICGWKYWLSYLLQEAAPHSHRNRPRGDPLTSEEEVAILAIRHVGPSETC